MNAISVTGFDPSFRNFGFSKGYICLDTGLIGIQDIKLTKTKKSLEKGIRKNADDLRCARELTRAVDKYIIGSEIIMAEVPVGSQSSRAAWALGITVGVLASVDTPMIQVTPAEVKMASVGCKTASKAEMIEWATSLYPELPWLMRKSKGQLVYMNDNEHMADAIAVVHAGIKTEQFKQLHSILD
tara:strand:- start:92001 stop:92555 length:555 start_codon:yes stop_codon:yes gene_type:complete